MGEEGGSIPGRGEDDLCCRTHPAWAFLPRIRHSTSLPLVPSLQVPVPSRSSLDDGPVLLKAASRALLQMGEGTDRHTL